MYYIRHLNAFFSFVRSDNRLTTSHVSLYLALFQYWNFNRFQNPFPIYRENIMQISKIGSKNTYYKCLKDLNMAKYIIYQNAANKYLPARISIIRLDKKQDFIYGNLELFNEETESAIQEPNAAQDPNSGQGVPNLRQDVPKEGHLLVPDVAQSCPNFDAGTVPIIGLYIKHKQINRVCKTHTSVFEKNKKIQNAINNPPFRDQEKNLVSQVANSVQAPTLSEIEEFFKSNKYPLKEARKFFYYNKGKAWKFPGNLPIADWQSLAHKWILNSGDLAKAPANSEDVQENIQNLYERFLIGEQIAKEILPEYADYLQLEITDAIKSEAIQRRINQLSGSNENAHNKLLQVYLSRDDTNPQLKSDLPNLMALCKRLAVLKTFQQWKTSG
jgi:hypothetical protein